MHGIVELQKTLHAEHRQAQAIRLIQPSDWIFNEIEASSHFLQQPRSAERLAHAWHSRRATLSGPLDRLPEGLSPPEGKLPRIAPKSLRKNFFRLYIFQRVRTLAGIAEPLRRDEGSQSQTITRVANAYKNSVHTYSKTLRTAQESLRRRCAAGRATAFWQTRNQGILAFLAAGVNRSSRRRGLALRSAIAQRKGTKRLTLSPSVPGATSSIDNCRGTDGR